MSIINMEQYRLNKIRKDQTERVKKIEQDTKDLTKEVMEMLKEVDELKKFYEYQDRSRNLKVLKGNQ